jgi:hypothetical protein
MANFGFSMPGFLEKSRIQGMKELQERMDFASSGNALGHCSRRLPTEGLDRHPHRGTQGSEVSLMAQVRKREPHSGYGMPGTPTSKLPAVFLPPPIPPQRRLQVNPKADTAFL